MKKWLNGILTVFVLCLVMIGALAIQIEKTVRATEENPFYVSGNDFEVTRVWSNGSYYQITLQYIGENADGLPQYETYPYDLGEGIYFKTDDTDYLKLKKASPLNTTTSSVVLTFNVKTTNGEIGYADVAPTKLIIPAETVVFVSEEYTNNGGKYTSLVFTSALTLEKYTTEAGEESWRCVQTQTYERYSIDFNEEDVFLGTYRNDNGLLCMQVKVPYTATQAATYTGTVPCAFNGINYSSTVEITQEENSNVITFVFTQSENVVGSMGDVTLVLTNGTIVDKTLGVQLDFENEKTLYGYADGIFTEEKRIEIHVTDGESYSITTVPATATTYSIPQSKGKNGHIFYAWLVGDTKYQENDTLDLSLYTQTGVHIVAEYIACGLVDGAWIRVGESLANSGIRFQSVITQEAYTKYEQYICGMGIIVMPTDMIESDKEFILQNYNGAKQALDYYVAKSDIDCKDGTFTLKATVGKVVESNYNRSYSARAYLVMNFGGINVYLWEDNIVQRSPYALASAALENAGENISSTHKAILQSYVDSVLNIEYNGTNATLIDKTGKQESVLLSHIITDNTVTIRIQTSITEFLCVTYNGMRIKESTQTYEDGVLIVTFQQSVTAGGTV